MIPDEELRCRYGNRPEDGLIAYRADACYRCSHCGFTCCCGCFADEQHQQQQQENSHRCFQDLNSSVAQAALRRKMTTSGGIVDESNNSSSGDRIWAPLTPISEWPDRLRCPQCQLKSNVSLELFVSPPFPWICETWHGEAFRNTRTGGKTHEGGASCPTAIGRYHRVRDELLRRNRTRAEGRIPVISPCFLGTVYGRAVPRLPVPDPAAVAAAAEAAAALRRDDGENNDDDDGALSESDHDVVVVDPLKGASSATSIGSNKYAGDAIDVDGAASKQNGSSSKKKKQRQQQVLDPAEKQRLQQLVQRAELERKRRDYIQSIRNALPTQLVLDPLQLATRFGSPAHVHAMQIASSAPASRRCREDEEDQHNDPFKSAVPQIRAPFFLTRGINSDLCIRSVAAARLHVKSRGACVKEGETFAYFLHNMDGPDTELYWFGIRDRAKAATSSETDDGTSKKQTQSSAGAAAAAPCREQLEDAVPIARVVAVPSALSSVRPHILEVPRGSGFCELRLMQGLRSTVGLQQKRAEDIKAQREFEEDMLLSLTNNNNRTQTQSRKTQQQQQSQSQSNNKNEGSKKKKKTTKRKKTRRKGGAFNRRRDGDSDFDDDDDVDDSSLSEEDDAFDDLVVGGGRRNTTDARLILYERPPLLTVTILIDYKSPELSGLLRHDDTSASTLASPSRPLYSSIEKQQHQQQMQPQQQQQQRSPNLTSATASTTVPSLSLNELACLHNAVELLLTGNNVGIWGLGSKRHLLSCIARAEPLSGFALHVLDGTQFKDSSGNSAKMQERGVLQQLVDKLREKVQFFDSEWRDSLGRGENRLKTRRAKAVQRLMMHGPSGWDFGIAGDFGWNSSAKNPFVQEKQVQQVQQQLRQEHNAFIPISWAVTGQPTELLTMTDINDGNAFAVPSPPQQDRPSTGFATAKSKFDTHPLSSSTPFAHPLLSTPMPHQQYQRQPQQQQPNQEPDQHQQQQQQQYLTNQQVAALFDRRLGSQLVDIEHDSMTDLLEPRGQSWAETVHHNREANKKKSALGPHAANALPALDMFCGNAAIDGLSEQSLRKIFGSVAASGTTTTTAAAAAVASSSSTRATTTNSNANNNNNSSKKNLISLVPDTLGIPELAHLYGSGHRVVPQGNVAANASFAGNQLEQHLALSFASSNYLRHVVVVFNIDWLPAQTLGRLSEFIAERPGRVVVLCCFDDSQFLRKAEAAYASSLRLRLLEAHTMSPYLLEASTLSESFVRLVDSAAASDAQNQQNRKDQEGKRVAAAAANANLNGDGEDGHNAAAASATYTGPALPLNRRQAMERAVLSSVESSKPLMYNMAQYQVQVGKDKFININTHVDQLYARGLNNVSASRVRALVFELTANLLAKRDNASNSVKVLNPEYLMHLCASAEDARKVQQQTK